MSLHKDTELKEAVLNLPEKEKDKLLVRLVGKDRMLMKQLRFKLLENEADLADRIVQVQTELNDHMDRITGTPHARAPRDYAFLLSELRYLSGIVNEHFNVTKDTLSELQLRLSILTWSFREAKSLFDARPFRFNDKLLAYQAGRIKYVWGKYAKLHEDLQFDFRDELNEVLETAWNSGLESYLSLSGLPKEV